MVKNDKTFPYFGKRIEKMQFLDGVQILHFIDYSFGPMLLHEHMTIEVMLVLDGSIQVAAEGRRYEVPRNGLVIVPPHVLHRSIILKETKRYDRMVFHIMPEYLDSVLPPDTGFSSEWFTDQVRVLDYSPEAFWILRNLYERAIHAQLQTERYRKFVMPYLAADFFINLYYFFELQVPSTLPASNHLVSEAVNCINEHFTEPDFSVDQILEEIHVSQGYLSRLFKAYTGGSIYHFIIGRRIFYAKDCLLGGASVQEAFMASGFTDYTSFLKAFKRQFGMTPSQLRKNKAKELPLDQAQPERELEYMDGAWYTKGYSRRESEEREKGLEE